MLYTYIYIYIHVVVKIEGPKNGFGVSLLLSLQTDFNKGSLKQKDEQICLASLSWLGSVSQLLPFSKRRTPTFHGTQVRRRRLLVQLHAEPDQLLHEHRHRLKGGPWPLSSSLLWGKPPNTKGPLLG